VALNEIVPFIQRERRRGGKKGDESKWWWFDFFNGCAKEGERMVQGERHR